MKVVCADPGKSDLIYCASKDENKLQTFRYTQNQRKHEIGTTRYSRIMEEYSNETFIGDKTVKQIETQLSALNSKTTDFEKFRTYCLEKNKLNGTLSDYYENYRYRKFKFNSFINGERTEAKLINNFKTKFGTPDKTIFVIGDYSTGNYHMKYKEPVICKKFRSIFKKAGYKTFLVNEFRTSLLCNGCGGELEQFLYKKNKKGESVLCHGLLRCQSVKPNSETIHDKLSSSSVIEMLPSTSSNYPCCNRTIHNRDKNAAQNMLNIVKSIFGTGERPKRFSRSI